MRVVYLGRIVDLIPNVSKWSSLYQVTVLHMGFVHNSLEDDTRNGVISGITYKTLPLV